MRISDWSSDVCSSDLKSLRSSASRLSSCSSWSPLSRVTTHHSRPTISAPSSTQKPILYGLGQPPGLLTSSSLSFPFLWLTTRLLLWRRQPARRHRQAPHPPAGPTREPRPPNGRAACRERVGPY